MTPAGHRPAWSSSNQVEWRAADALKPETYEELAASCDAAVHTVGILLEADYKGATSGPFDIFRGLAKGWGLDGGSNPLDPSSKPNMSYEVMNRDTALTVAQTFLSTRKAAAPFVYISAEDIFRPIISSKYIETKRQAEEDITELSQDSSLLRPIFLRPGLMYHPQTRPLSTLPAAAFDLSASLHKWHESSRLPIPTAASILKSFPGADLSALSRLMTLPPLHVDTVAKAACAAISDDNVRGPIDTYAMRKLAGFEKPAEVKSWPSQSMAGSGKRTPGQVRTYTTSARRSGPKSSSSSSAGESSTKLPPVFVAAIIVAGASFFLMASPLLNEAPVSATQEKRNLVEVTQQDLMRARATTQGVYAWGSNRYNVVAPDSPLVTLVRSPRSIPYFDGIALRDLVLEEKHGVAVDANGDVLQWGLGFFDPSSRQRSDDALDDVPLGRRREKEKANEMTPKGSMAAQPMAPVKTLVGKDIVKVVASDRKVFALGSRGDIYIFAAVQSEQWPGKAAGWSWNPLSLFGLLSKPMIDHEKFSLVPGVASFARGEKIVEVSSGTSHLLARSNKGRTFSAPIDEDGNAFGQLGTRRIILNSPKDDGKVELVEAVMEPRMLIEQIESIPKTFRQSDVLPSWALPPGMEGDSVGRHKPRQYANVYERRKVESGLPPLTEPSWSIRFCTTLHEVPALRGVEVAQIAAGSEHSLARTPSGRVLGWGRQTHGQSGLGAGIAVEAVPVPTEVVLSKCFPNTSVDITCTDIAAGADNSFFVMSRREPGTPGVGTKIDVLAVGKGQWGTLGNAMWSQVTATPVRVKTVSGLLEYSERTGKTHPVPIHSISVGKPGSVALVLDTVETEGHQAFGRDVMVFGHNAAYQLGTGKRSNLSVPQHLQPLPPSTQTIGGEVPGLDTDKADPKLREADVNSGALTHMPHKRLQLVGSTKGETRSAPDFANDGQDEGRVGGKKKKRAEIEETIICGSVSMAIFWKVQQ